jgi:very-short-patch-repair endonuclease
MQQRDGKPACGRTADALIAGLATRAHGVVARRELLTAGVTAEEIKQRLKRSSLIAVHRGVYRVGHRAASREALYTAALKACGDEAVLCGRAAAHLWGLLRGPLPQPEVLASTKRRVAGIITHRSPDVDTPDVTSRDGLRVTTVPRTLVDVASSLPVNPLGRACHEADVRYGVTPEQVESVLSRRPSTPGAGRLRRIIHGDEPVTLSRLESRFLQRLREARLPIPRTNCPAGSRRVDCRWPEQRLTVELDGFRYHRSRHAWERDRQREREARTRGDDFRRYTYRDVFEDPAFMLAELRSLL